MVKKVYENTEVCIVAEVGSVHDGSFGNAMRLIDVAAEYGANVVKFQTHIAEAETLYEAPMPAYFKGEPRYEYFERTAFDFSQWQDLKSHCKDVGVEFLSSPFSIAAVELLEKLDVARYKIPSGEVTNLPYLEIIAQTHKPIVLSSGMSSWEELDNAVNMVLKYHNNLTVLQCTSEYPCPYEQVGLNVMLEMKKRYNLPVGLSDHTLTIYASLAAVTLGAALIERHLTFSRLMYGSDARHSLEPEQFANMVQGIRAIETMLASKVDKHSVERFVTMKETFEKSLVSLIDIPAGTIITEAMIGIKKPGTGIPAGQFNETIGKKVRNFIPKDTLLNEQDLID